MTPGFDVRIGINPISWSNDDLPSLGGETPLESALAEGAAIGYQGFELGNKFPREPKALRSVLERAWAGARVGLVFGAARAAHRSTRRSPRSGRISSCSPKAARSDGLRRSRRQHPGRDACRCTSGRASSRATQWREYGERVTRVRALHARRTACASRTTITWARMSRAPADVDRLMEHAGDEVGLLFDSGHMTVRRRRCGRRCSRSTCGASAMCIARTCGPRSSGWRAIATGASSSR